MKYFFIWLWLIAKFSPIALADEQKEGGSSNLRQYYSGKFGFYQPSDGLNNGLLLGIDGITEFVHYNFFLSGAIDLYPKQTISIFKDPQPDVQQQAMVLLLLHVNFGYQIFNEPTADSRGYVGVGAGYYFYFYSIEYRTDSGGLLGGLATHSDSKNGGNIFATVFARVLIGKIFLEPRLYIASKKEDSIGGFTYVVNPSGFAVTLGFQY